MSFLPQPSLTGPPQHSNDKRTAPTVEAIRFLPPRSSPKLIYGLGHAVSKGVKLVARLTPRLAEFSSSYPHHRDDVLPVMW